MDQREPGRRGVLTGAGALGLVAVGGCAGGGGGTRKPALPDAIKGKVIARTSEIPVGGGKIISAHKIVVTQPTKGTYKAFTAVCTHQGCTVGEITGGVIQCPCHGSEFSVADGSVKQGPADAPLASYKVTVKGDGITVA